MPSEIDRGLEMMPVHRRGTKEDRRFVSGPAEDPTAAAPSVAAPLPAGMGVPDTLAGLARLGGHGARGPGLCRILGVPPIMGLYTIVPPLVAYALLGTSRLLVVGPDTATGLISALTVGALAAQGTADFNALTSTLAVLIGVFFLLLGALRMGWVAAFIPTPVMRGFIEGLVCVTIIGQVPHLRHRGTSGNFFAKLWFLLHHLPDVAFAPVLTAC